MRINLLPPEVGERQRIRRRALMAIAAGVVVLALIAGVYLIQVVRLGQAEEELAAQEAVNAGLRTQIAGLQDVTVLQQEVAQTRELVSTLLTDRVLWSGVLRDLSLVIPGEAWLSGLSGQTGATAVEGTAAPVTEGALVGQISFNGFAFDHREVALWLSRLEDVRGFINPWLSSSAKTEIGDVDIVSFTSSVDLSEQALARANGGGA